MTRNARTSAPALSAAASHADASDILASIRLVPYEWRIDTDVLTWGANAAEVLQVAEVAQIATGRGYAAFLDPKNTSTRYDAVMQEGTRDYGAGVPYQTEYCLQTGRDGATRLWIEDNGRWFAGLDGRPARAHGVVRAITERHDHDERLAYLSRFDGLTGEMNRNALTEALTTSLDDTLKYRGSCGFMLIAVDNLARINEAYGFGVADEVIAAVGRRLRSRMRGGDVLGRFSSNKFGVVLNTCTPDDLSMAADRFLAAVREDVVQTAHGPVAATITIGAVAAPRHARTVAEILAHAQESLDSAKAKRRGSFVAYRPNIEREAVRQENVRSTDKIIAALNERRILLAFEPVVATSTREVAFYECLMRIRRADGSLVPANDIMPIAEQLGLVRLIDHRVVELVIAELSAAPTLKASVNVSPDSITDPDWWASLGAQLRTRPGVAQRMILEITETAAIQNIDDTAGFVTRAKDLGCRIAIDDFGAGYTSFRNLRRLGVDMIKIDGAFVQNLARSEDDRVFVRTLVELGRSLGLETVAEWVQDEEAAATLKAWGCDYLQGDLVGRASVERPWAVVAPPPESADALNLTFLRCSACRPSSASRKAAAAAHRGRWSVTPASRSRSSSSSRRANGVNIEKARWNTSMLRRTVSSSGPNRADPERLRHLIAEFLLFARQRIDRGFQIARHQHLHRVAVEADELAQEIDRQQVLRAFLVLLLGDDLDEHRARDVLAGLRVEHREILAALHHGGEIFERHIGAGASVVEPPVGVLLDRDRTFRFGGWCSLLDAPWARRMRICAR